MSEQRIEDARIRAEKAKQLLDNELFKESFSTLKEQLVAKAETVGINDKETQHSIILSMQLLKRIESHIVRHINDGKVAEFSLKQKRKLFGG